MTNQITPPPELVQQWRNGGPSYAIANNAYEHYIAAQAAQWGADQELEACVEWFDNQSLVYHRDLEHTFRTARRPKTPSLKEQALEQLRRVNAVLQFQATGGETSVIRRALEAIDD